MSTIPANVARVPNILSSRLSLANLTRTNLDLFKLQTQLATGRAINRPSDDSVRATAIGLLDDRLERAEQRTRNLNHADAALNTLDQALGEINDLILQGSSIGKSQISLGADANQRAGQAIVVNSLIAGLFEMSSREGSAGYIFGGSAPGRAPVLGFRGGYRYVGEGTGLVTDIGIPSAIPITIGGSNAIGATSFRLIGDQQLAPSLTDQTRLSDLMGARGLDIVRGELEISIDGGTRVTIDLTNADTIDDVTDAIEAVIRDYESANTVAILGPGGVSFANQNLTLDLAAGHNAEFFDLGANTTGRDLGLVSDTPFSFAPGLGDGLNVQPRLTPLTRVDSVFGAPLGSIRLNNMGVSEIVDLSGAVTFQDIANLIESADLGVRVGFDREKRRMIVTNEVSAGTNQAMSIEEIPGNGGTAGLLGIRTMNLDTRIDDFNEGRGVDVITGNADPITGVPDPALDVDFTITLGGGVTITVNLRPEDIITVGTVIQRIRDEADAQLPAQGVNPADFTVGLTDGDNGISFGQTPAMDAIGPITIERMNRSVAAEQLGLMDGTYDTASATFVGEDRAAVRVDSIFTALIDLRNALQDDDDFGIQLATQRLDRFVDDVSGSRALVGGYARRVADAKIFEEDRAILDETVRSQLRDLDFIEASTRFNLLQVQLSAGLQAVAASNSTTLLDFLG